MAGQKDEFGRAHFGDAQWDSEGKDDHVEAGVGELVCGECDGIKATPWALSGEATQRDQDETATRDREEQVIDMSAEGRPGVPEPAPREVPPQDVYITRKDLRDYGYTNKCRKCQAIKRGDNSLASRSHDSECRERIKKAMIEDDMRKEKLQKVEDKKNEYIARQVETGEEREKAAKRVRVAVEGEASASSSSSSAGQGGVPPVETITTPSQQDTEVRDEGTGKRMRDAQEDEAERERPTHYRSIEEEDDKEDEVMDDGTMNYVETKKQQRRFEDEDMEGLLSMSEGKYHVVEIFSPPRVCSRAREKGMRGGWSLDWQTRDPVTGKELDLRKEHTQKKAMAMLKRDKPGLLVASPPCTLFSALQHLAGDTSHKNEQAWKDAVEMVNFSVKMCREQMHAGRKFVFEHPLCATSWKVTDLKELMRAENVNQVVAHQCAFGLVSEDKLGVAPAMKPTRFLTNSVAIAERLHRRCSRDHRHVQLLGGRAAAAAKYPRELVEAILEGYEIERASSVFTLEDAMTALHIDTLHEDDGVDWKYVDDITGEELDAKKVVEARREEMETFDKMKVYIHVTREEVARVRGPRRPLRRNAAFGGHEDDPQ